MIITGALSTTGITLGADPVKRRLSVRVPKQITGKRGPPDTEVLDDPCRPLLVMIAATDAVQRPTECAVSMNFIVLHESGAAGTSG